MFYTIVVTLYSV